MQGGFDQRSCTTGKYPEEGADTHLQLNFQAMAPSALCPRLS